MEPLLRDPLITQTCGRPALTSTATASSAPAAVITPPAFTAPASYSSRNQPASSTRRHLSRFELEQAIQPGRQSTRLAAERAAKAANPEAENAQAKRRRGNSIQEDNDGHDSEEDRLFELELQRLQATCGAAEPFWSTIPEFAGLTRATRTYSLRPRPNQHENMPKV